MEVGALIIVNGMVQGVGFRFFVCRIADKLNLKGYVRNLYDGSVEVVAEGDRSLLEELIKLLKVGTRSSSVTDVNVKWIEATHQFKRFEIKF
jgi:acylphosphatase